MPALKQYQLFISHSWKYNKQYDNLIGLLDKAKLFYYFDYSVPKEDPLQVSHAKLYSALENQIKHTNIFLIIAGKYVTYSETIPVELELAQKYNIPILAIKPWGNEVISSVADKYATISVGWNTQSIVEAIRLYAK